MIAQGLAPRALSTVHKFMAMPSSGIKAIEHRAEVFDFASVECNEENNVWSCDCAKVYGHAQAQSWYRRRHLTIHYSPQVVMEYAGCGM